MSAVREGKKIPKAAMEPRVMSWEERKSLADKDEELLEKQIEDLKTWACDKAFWTVDHVDARMMNSMRSMVFERRYSDKKTIYHNETKTIDSMNEEELKEYLKNRPDELKTVKIEKNNSKQNQRAEKPKCSTSNGIMASVWKFHKEEEEEEEQNQMLEF